MNTPYTLTIASSPETVAEAVAWAEGLGASEGLPEELTDRVSLALSEAVSNAVRHGNEHASERAVRLGWCHSNGLLTVTVLDEGEGPELEQLLGAELPDDPLATGGRGYFIMRTLADAVRVDGRALVLEFRDPG